MNTESLKSSLTEILFTLGNIATATLKENGDTTETSQLQAVKAGLFKAEMATNGIGQDDVKENCDAEALKTHLRSLISIATDMLNEVESTAEQAEVDSDDRNHDSVAGHEILWYVEDYMGTPITELDEASEEHLTAMLVDGYLSGELCVTHYPDDNTNADPVELRGWWEKV